MSYFTAKVSKIQSNSSLHLVHFSVNNQTLCMMSLELDAKVKIGTKVKLVVKPTHVAISKKFIGELSYSNQLNASIDSINNGELLSNIKLKLLNTTLESIITLDASQKMNLKVTDDVTVLINASELSISEIYND